MKALKSLLLGSAAGLVAVAGSQAAELPVKAAPVEYVKICSLYGDGFFYIPGTDTCLKIGGYVRWDADVGAGGNHTPYITAGGGFQDRSINTNDYQMRTRFQISADARTQTDYGTLRAYIRMGAEETTNATDGGAGTFYIERGFIQFAGFTAGKTQSYLDFFQGVFSYGGYYIGGGSGTVLQSPNLFAYTAQFGNGISAWGICGSEASIRPASTSLRRAKRTRFSQWFSPLGMTALRMLAGRRNSSARA
jgi:hypothetical protein